MKKLSKYPLSVLFLFSVPASSIMGEDAPDFFLLYDFGRQDNSAEFIWEDFTDQVMGGKSDMSTLVMEEEGFHFLRMRGEVSLENRGGFIQTRLRLASQGSSFNGNPYDGIRLVVRGKGSGYYLFFRTKNTLLPWKYYAAPVPLDENWQIIDIPWSAVGKGDYGLMKDFDPSRLKSVALVAYGKEFMAQADLVKIGLYKSNMNE